MSEEKPKPEGGEEPKPAEGDKPKPVEGNKPKTGEGDEPKPVAEKPNAEAADESEPDFTADLDGDMTLDQTTDRCEVEQDAGIQLRGIRFRTLTAGPTVLLVNKAEFMDKPIGRLKHLLFVRVGTNEPAKLKKQKVEAEKWTFICDSQVYVEKNVTRVMVFGKRKL